MRNSPTGVRLVINLASKTLLTLISVISVLNLAGFELRLKESSTDFKVLDLFQKPANDKEESPDAMPTWESPGQSIKA
ncbi:hypothetical protein HHK36_030846 [Tetracentron sinense]|uniref:Uncharacterized protein n=1 Tax=Tetracentron sinense TaxID=13715 RepID=A0A834Y8C0_TETSI|nr:hypothetical protein HHK36_030846 [Tetracentron sinense]